MCLPWSGSGKPFSLDLRESLCALLFELPPRAHGRLFSHVSAQIFTAAWQCVTVIRFQKKHWVQIKNGPVAPKWQSNFEAVWPARGKQNENTLQASPRSPGIWARQSVDTERGELWCPPSPPFCQVCGRESSMQCSPRFFTHLWVNRMSPFHPHIPDRFPGWTVVSGFKGLTLNPYNYSKYTHWSRSFIWKA